MSITTKEHTIISKHYISPSIRNKIDTKSLTLLIEAPIGRGAFAEVKVMSSKKGDVYAVKEIDKRRLEGQTSSELVRNEVLIHQSLVHMNIIRLLSVDEDSNFIRLVLEYAPNGNLFNFIRRKGFLEEKEAARIFYGIVKGVQYLHNKKIIHRDLKPENILLIDEIPKIIDFGWSTESKGNKHKNLCGTLEYMGPEVIYSGCYGHKIDIWALGILLYEMLHGKAPIRAKSVIDMAKAFSEPLEFEYRSDVSDSAKSLINSILKIDADERPEIEDILTHSWLDSELANDIEWEDGRRDFEHNSKQCK